MGFEGLKGEKPFFYCSTLFSSDDSVILGHKKPRPISYQPINIIIYYHNTALFPKTVKLGPFLFLSGQLPNIFIFYYSI